MGADSTLVAAARYYGKTKAAADVPDMTKLYEGQREITKTYLEGITDVFAKMKADEKARKAAKNAQLRAFKAQAKTARHHLLTKEASQPMKVHDAIYDRFKSLEDEFKLYTASEDNDTPENEKMRANLYAQLQMITNQAVESRGTIATKATMANSLVGAKISSQDMAIGRAIMGVDGNYENIELSFNEKGELVYHVLLEGMDAPVSWTIADFDKKMIIHNNELDLYQLQSEKTQYQLGLTDERDFDAKGQKNTLLRTVLKDEEIFNDMAFSEINGRRSWRDSLLEDVNIATTAVEHLFVEDVKIGLVDVNNDGVINILDYNLSGDEKITEADISGLSEEQKILWQQNHELIVDALTNTENPAFNFEVSSDALADDFVFGLNEHFVEGRGDKKPKGGGSGRTRLSPTARMEKARAKEIDRLVKLENPSLLEMNQIIGGSGRRYEIKKVGDEYVIYDQSTGDDMVMKRFNVKDKKSRETWLYNYSGTSTYYKGGDVYGEFDSGEGAPSPVETSGIIETYNFDRLTTKGAMVGKSNKLLFSYGKSKYFFSRIREHFGGLNELGGKFTFHDTGTIRDWVKIKYVINGIAHEVGEYRFDTASDAEDLKSAQKAQKKMIETIERHGRGEFGSEIDESQL